MAICNQEGHTYATYAAHCRAQLVRPMDQEPWERGCMQQAKGYTVEFHVSADMAKHGELPEGWHCNHFGPNHTLLKTEKFTRN